MRRKFCQLNVPKMAVYLVDNIAHFYIDNALIFDAVGANKMEGRPWANEFLS